MAKFAPCRKLVPTEFKYASTYGKPNLSATIFVYQKPLSGGFHFQRRNTELDLIMNAVNLTHEIKDDFSIAVPPRRFVKGGVAVRRREPMECG